MSDPVAEKSGFLCMYMSGHPDTLVAYAKWYGKVEEPIVGAKMTSIDCNKIVLKCTPKSKSKQDFDVVVPIEPPLSGYDAVKPRLLEMKALAQEGLGMIKAPKITAFYPPSKVNYALASAVLVPLSALAYFAPSNPTPGSLAETALVPIYFLRNLLGERAMATQFGILVALHTLESLYTFSLCWRHSSGFFLGAQWVLSTFFLGLPIWSELRKRIQDARIDSVMKVQ
ncbi:hypothetical protein BKA70DRAFT_1110166 [Coprinopsis sp. MPI-PUGE-AT-0042]|nr:hypothetical protein BKA70DRAFT_1112743 [Coprinopsis sp. MPI-PUGE-AT-0042]KAH6903856.1 hypothetical protein BKA70DRAFT_1110166 [Coprinopsis sp. MPI-PUGE-AT-0042]